jgi:hypothetical protein
MKIKCHVAVLNKNSGISRLSILREVHQQLREINLSKDNSWIIVSAGYNAQLWVLMPIAKFRIGLWSSGLPQYRGLDIFKPTSCLCFQRNGFGPRDSPELDRAAWT